MSSNIKEIRDEINNNFPDKLEIPRIATKNEVMNAELDNEHLEFPEPTESFKYREYIEIRDKLLEKYKNKIDPKTKELYEEVKVIQIANNIYKKKLEKNRVESLKDGLKRFTEYYTKKYGKNSINKMIKDMERKRKDALKVGSIHSGKYYNKDGPQKYDLDGVDTGVKNMSGEAKNLYTSLKKKSRKSKKSKKSRKSKKSKKSRKSKK